MVCKLKFELQVLRNDESWGVRNIRSGDMRTLWHVVIQVPLGGRSHTIGLASGC